MSWTNEEFETLDLGDLRLNRRAIKIVDALGLAPGRTLPQSCRTWGETKACYHFFLHTLVSSHKLLQPHFEKTLERIQEHKVVLLPSDTTEIDYTSKKIMEKKERLSNKKNGIWLHPTIAVTPEGLHLGIVEANFWNRKPEVCEKNRNALDKAPIEEKESYRWLKSYERACEIARQAPDTQIISMFDREGDIIEIFERAEQQKKQEQYANFIIRSQHDRLVKGTEEYASNMKLRETLKNIPSMGEIEFTISTREERKGRKVKQQLKATKLILRPNGKREVEVNVVMALEENPSQGEAPLIWIFITDLPIESFDNVSQVVQYYLCRWQIELFFKVLKSGCKIEERQLQTTDRMKNLITLFMILSWRILFTMMLSRVCSEIPCGDVFEEAEWKSVYKILNRKKHLPRKSPPLGDFIKMVASLGGYVESKAGGPPGIKTVWRGMLHMIDYAIAWEAFGR